MIDRYILDETGVPVPEPDLMVWGRWFENADNRVVQRTEIGAVAVSTVFLGLDHAFGQGAPLLWESLVFGGPRDGEMRRYATRAAAEQGHAELVRIEEAAAG